MLFYKHSLGLMALNLLLRSRYAFGQEDHTVFETEFRLMVLTGDPDNVEATVELEVGGESVDFHDNDKSNNKDWDAGVGLRKEDGNSRLTYMGWSRPSPDGRNLRIYKKGEDKESGMRVRIRLYCRPRYSAYDSAPSF